MPGPAASESNESTLWPLTHSPPRDTCTSRGEATRDAYELAGRAGVEAQLARDDERALDRLAAAHLRSSGRISLATEMLR